VSAISELIVGASTPPVTSDASCAPASGALRIVVAGQHPLTLCGLTQVFANEGDCSVVGVCTDTEAIPDTVRRHRPDIVVLDLPPALAFKMLRRLQRERLDTRTVFLTGAAEDDQMADALRLGAHALVRKELPPDEFMRCIRRVQKGEAIEPPTVGHLIPMILKAGTGAARQPARELTPRETEIARLAVRGIPTKDIATRLNVKQGTVKIHLHSIYEKLNVGGRLGLVLFARRHGLA